MSLISAWSISLDNTFKPNIFIELSAIYDKFIQNLAPTSKDFPSKQNIQ